MLPTQPPRRKPLEPAGHWVSLTPQRVMISDLMDFSQKLPSIPVQRRMRLGVLLAARNEARPRPSWRPIFTKAFALLAAESPPLRRTLLGLPWAHH